MGNKRSLQLRLAGEKAYIWPTCKITIFLHFFNSKLQMQNAAIQCIRTQIGGLKFQKV